MKTSYICATGTHTPNNFCTRNASTFQFPPLSIIQTSINSSSQQAYIMGSCLSKSSASRRGSLSNTSTSRSGPISNTSTSQQVSLSEITTSRRGSQVRTVNEKESSLHVLPVEVLQYISAIFLPPDAAASLALCSLSMLRIIGTQAFRSLRLECHSIEKTRFLKNLEKDLPDWLFCHHCSMFHPVHQIRDPTQCRYFSVETECAQVNGFVSIRYDFNIRYEFAQLIMRNYRLGRPHMLYLERLSKRYTKHLPDISLEDLYTADIVESELLIHIKHTLRLFKDWDVSTIRLNLPSFCRHLIDQYIDSIFAQTLRCRLSHANRLPCIECKKWKHCPGCSTSFQVNIRGLENLVTEVQVNVWRCLGSCESPFNSEWRGQVERNPPSRTQRKRNDQNLPGRIVPIVEVSNEDDEDWEDITEWEPE